MFAFLVRRLLVSVLTLFIVVTISFFLMRLAPGSPFNTERLTPGARAAMEAYYHLDRPIGRQYLDFLHRLVLHGELGRSMRRYDYTVNEIIQEQVGYSFALGGLAFLIAMAGGVGMGLLSAARKNRLPDHLAMSLSIVGVCVPSFVVGPVLILVLSFGLGWLPPAYSPDAAGPADWIMPAFTLALLPMAYVARLTRSGVLDVLNKDYIRTARAKGAGELRVHLIHALKNGITPVVSYAGPMAASVLVGSLVVESIFQFPGVGKEFVNAALNRDYPLLMGVLILDSALIIGFNVAVDVFYSVLDPRVRTA